MTVASSTPGSTGFAATLKAATQEDHTAAESSRFVADLVAGALPRTAYADLLAQSHRVYEVLEHAVEASRSAQVAAFHDPALVRLPALEADLLHLVGPGWREALPPLPATLAYRERLREVGDWPAGLVAHHYLRYLGDLSGGQVLRRLVGRAYGLTGDGLRFYTFDGIGRIKPFKDRYRAALDAAPWDADEQARVVEEVALGFRLNRDLFTDLGARHPAAPASATG